MSILLFKRKDHDHSPETDPSMHRAEAGVLLEFKEIAGDRLEMINRSLERLTAAEAAVERQQILDSHPKIAETSKDRSLVSADEEPAIKQFDIDGARIAVALAHQANLRRAA